MPEDFSLSSTDTIKRSPQKSYTHPT